MPDCDYCEASFADEDSYLTHLHEAHDTDELSRIDQRRVEQAMGDDDDERATGPIILGGLLVFTAGILVYVTFFMGSGGPQVDPANADRQPGAVDRASHQHGTINVTIDGQQLDFSRDRFQNPGQYPAFHFENGNGRVWHVHAENVTLEYAMATLGIGVKRDKIRYDGTTYSESDGNTNVTVLVNNRSVDPTSYVLRGVPSDTGEGGDHIEIVVTTG